MDQATVVMGLPSWQVLTIVFAVMDLLLTALGVALVGILRSINEHQNSINAAIEREMQVHKDWREEMKAVNDKVDDLVINAKVEERLRERSTGSA